MFTDVKLVSSIGNTWSDGKLWVQVPSYYELSVIASKQLVVPPGFLASTGEKATTKDIYIYFIGNDQRYL